MKNYSIEELKNIIKTGNKQEIYRIFMNINPEYRKLIDDDELRLKIYINQLLRRNYSHKEMFDLLMIEVNELVERAYLEHSVSVIPKKDYQKHLISLLPDYVFTNSLFNSITESFDRAKTYVSILVDSDDKKLQRVKKLSTDFERVKVIESMKDEYFKLLGVKELFLSENKKRIIQNIKDINKIKLFLKNDKPFDDIVLLLILKLNDKDKLEYLKTLQSMEKRIQIILTMSDNIIESYINNPEYLDYRNVLISRLSNKDRILYYFKDLDSKNKLKVIGLIENETIKTYLINKINSVYHKALILPNKYRKESIVKDIKLDTKLDIDKDITIGLELEAFNNYMVVQRFKNLVKLLDKWTVKSEITVERGLEVVSPVLRFNSDSLKQLKYITELMNINEFDVNKQCGGHIHLGYDYFRELEELKVLINLYTICEDLIYLLSNRENSNIRNGVMDYATPFQKYRGNNPILLLEEIKKAFDTESVSNYYEGLELVKNVQRIRYYGLNFQNVGTRKNTIEFRMPNGELNYNEVIENIRLFGKIFMAVKNILNDYNYRMLYEELFKVESIEEKYNIFTELLDLKDETFDKRFVTNLHNNGEYIKILKIKL